MPKTNPSDRYGKASRHLLQIAGEIANCVAKGEVPTAGQLTSARRALESLSPVEVRNIAGAHPPQGRQSAYEKALIRPEMTLIVSNHLTVKAVHTTRKFDRCQNMLTTARMRGSYTEAHLNSVEKQLKAGLDAFDAIVESGRKQLRNGKTPNRPDAQKKNSGNKTLSVNQEKGNKSKPPAAPATAAEESAPLELSDVKPEVETAEPGNPKPIKDPEPTVADDKGKANGKSKTSLLQKLTPSTKKTEQASAN